MDKDFELDPSVNEESGSASGGQTRITPITPTWVTYTLTMLTTATSAVSGSNHTENSDCY